MCYPPACDSRGGVFLAFRLQPSTLSHACSRYADEKGPHPAPWAFLSTVVREGCRPLVLLGGASLLLFCKPVGIPLSRVGVGGIFKSPPPGAVFLGFFQSGKIWPWLYFIPLVMWGDSCCMGWNHDLYLGSRPRVFLLPDFYVMTKKYFDTFFFNWKQENRFYLFLGLYCHNRN